MGSATFSAGSSRVAAIRSPRHDPAHGLEPGMPCRRTDGAGPGDPAYSHAEPVIPSPPA